MAPLKMVIVVIAMMLASLLGSKTAGAGQIGGIDQFLRNVTDVLYQIEDNVRPPFPTAWFQATLVLALVWMLAPLLVNLWDATIRESKRVTSQVVMHWNLGFTPFQWMNIPSTFLCVSFILSRTCQPTRARAHVYVAPSQTPRFRQLDPAVPGPPHRGKPPGHSTGRHQCQRCLHGRRQARQQQDDAIQGRDAIVVAKVSRSYWLVTGAPAVEVYN
ncbi:hypothetical protein OQA88_4855 [Cercophora sp. LCS_1]